MPSADAGKVLVIGDWGSGTEPEGAVAAAMERYSETEEITAILTTGDNFYSDQIDFLLQPYEWTTAAGIPFWLAWGNHDVETPERIAGIDSRFGAPRWVTHQWGGVDVLILDSNQVSSPEQLDFASEEMERSDRPTVVVFHHPPYSCSNHGDTNDVLETWLPLFDDDVTLVLSGHDHNYQRFQDGSTTYVVSGGGGSKVYGVGECPTGHVPLIDSAATFHFLVLEQTAGGIEVEVRDVGGNVLDEFFVVY